MRFIALVVGSMLTCGIAAAKEAKTEIKIKGMTCGSCVAAVKRALSSTKGVKQSVVSLEKGTATVVFEDTQVTPKQLMDKIKGTGFDAEATGGGGQ
jgi:copper chaperone CopZ